MARPTNEQTEALKRRMLEERDTLYGTARAELTRLMQQPIGDVAGEVADPGDASVATLFFDLGHAEVQRRIDAIRAIDAALERIEAAEYGVCIDCGGDIDYERLAVFPAAVRDIVCQTRYEKTFATQETPTL